MLPGIVVGLLGSLLVRGLLSSVLFGVEPLDPVSFLVAPALLAGIPLLAGYLPSIPLLRCRNDGIMSLI